MPKAVQNFAVSPESIFSAKPSVGPTPIWNIAFDTLQKSSDPTYILLARALIKSIEDDLLPVGTRLPSSRQLAEALAVGRNTVLRAISILVDQGYLESKDRSGVRVAAGYPQKDGQAANVSAPFSGETDTHSNQITGEPQREKILYSLIYGQFDASLFPTAHWRECERAALSVRDINSWGRDTFNEDDAALIEQLRTKVLPFHGIWAKPTELLVTLGGQEGRYLVARLLCTRGMQVGLENPGMPDMSKIIELTGATRVSLPMDQNGIALSPELGRSDVVFTTAGHQCPTGVSMPLHRRRMLLEFAKQREIQIIEDTFEIENFIQDSESRSLKSLDAEGRIIYIGSLSKHLAPGLRIGIIVASSDIIVRLRELRRLIHRHPPGNTQRTLACFIERGFYRSHVKRLAREMDRRCVAFSDALQRLLPDFTWQHCAGTANFWITMPDSINAMALADQSRQLGLLIEPGNRFFHAIKPSSKHLRVGLSSIGASEIQKAVAILKKAVDNMSRR